MLCRCRGPVALTEWAASQESALLKAMGFARGKAPSYGTLQRTARDWNVASFERVLQDRAKEVLKGQGQAGQLQDVALDGKVLRGESRGAIAKRSTVGSVGSSGGSDANSSCRTADHP